MGDEFVIVYQNKWENKNRSKINRATARLMFSKLWGLYLCEHVPVIFASLVKFLPAGNILAIHEMSRICITVHTTYTVCMHQTCVLMSKSSECGFETLAGDHDTCVPEQDTLLSLLLFPQEYKWVS